MVRAVYEAVNQFESSDSPLLASPQGGVAERFKKHREASTDREAGVVFRMKTKRKTTPAASALVASRNFLMTQPPLLAVMQGGDYLRPAWLALILLTILFSPDAAAQTKPSRIVSTTLATDEILAALVDPSRIVAMSQFAADPQISTVADVARKINVVADRDPERVVRLQPD